MSTPLGAAGAVPLAVLERDGFPESVHLGAAVVVTPDGEVAPGVGDGEASIYPRSALKPFQTIAALEAGALLDRQGLAIVSSSHAGTPRHIAAVRAVLAMHGLNEGALRTPEAFPAALDPIAVASRPATATRIAMNCSGNHAGMLAAAVAAGWDTDNYLAADHPVHAVAERVLLRYTGAIPTHRSVDGCGGPVWALSLVALARGYGRIAAERPDLVNAVRADPELIEGPRMLTTRAIQTTGVFGKSGAEGVWCGVTRDGAAVAVKVLDGAGRVASAIAVSLLARAGYLSQELADRYLAEPAFTVTGGGRRLGRIRVLV